MEMKYSVRMNLIICHSSIGLTHLHPASWSCNISIEHLWTLWMIRWKQTLEIQRVHRIMSETLCESKRKRGTDVSFLFLFEHFKSLIESRVHQIRSKQQRKDQLKSCVVSSRASTIETFCGRIAYIVGIATAEPSSISYWCLGCVECNSPSHAVICSRLI